MNFERLVGFVTSFCVTLSGAGMVVTMVNSPFMNTEQSFWGKIILLPIFVAITVMGMAWMFNVIKSSFKKGGEIVMRLRRFISYVMMVFGGLMVLGSLEPEHMTPLWHVVAFAVTGFTLLSFGWRMYVATEPRRIFLNR